MEHAADYASQSRFQPYQLNTKLLIHRFYIINKDGKKIVSLHQEMYLISSTGLLYTVLLTLGPLFPEGPGKPGGPGGP